MLVAQFTAWAGGDEFQQYWFSNKKIGDDRYLYHVHLIPQNEPDKRQKWDSLRKKPRQRHRRRSDRYLLYSANGRGDYLLVDILDDPGAHLLWTPGYKQTLQDYATVAENFYFDDDIPA